MKVNGKHYRTVWMEDEKVKMIEQRDLPYDFNIIELETAEEVAEAISRMSVRGAGAIGGTGGFGMALGILKASKSNFEKDIEQAAEKLRNSRPTAQDLFYAIDRVLEVVSEVDDIEDKKSLALEEAQAIADEDAEACEKIGEFGNKLIKDNYNILTHCNAGWLAFVDWGSALSPIYKAKRAGKNVHVWVDETRPRNQGARLTAWELSNENIDHSIIVDNAAGFYMQRDMVDLVIVGSDRIARNGDVANKIGTYEKALVANENDIPFYVAAPTSTIDLESETGFDIPIEERDQSEVKKMRGKLISNPESKARNPAFDVTPARLVEGIITEKGIVEASREGIESLFEK